MNTQHLRSAPTTLSRLRLATGIWMAWSTIANAQSAPPPPTPGEDTALLEAHRWILDADAPRREIYFPVASDGRRGQLTIDFEPSGGYSAYLGCNTIAGNFERRTDGTLFAGSSGTTLAGCEPEFARAEDALRMLFSTHPTLKIEGGAHPTLTIDSSSGEHLRFGPANPRGG